MTRDVFPPAVRSAIMRKIKGRDTGEVSISLATSPLLSLLPSAMATFRKRFPDAVLRVQENFFTAIESDVLAGGVDFHVGPLDTAGV